MSTSFESPAGMIEVLDIVPRQGPGGIIAQSCDAAISLAADEINRSARIPEEFVLRISTRADVGRGLRAAVHRHDARRHRVARLRGPASRDGGLRGPVPYLYAVSHEGLSDELPRVPRSASTRPGRQCPRRYAATGRAVSRLRVSAAADRTRDGRDRMTRPRSRLTPGALGRTAGSLEVPDTRRPRPGPGSPNPLRNPGFPRPPGNPARISPARIGVGFEIVDRTSGRRMRTLEDYTPTSESSTERNRPRPSSLGPVSGSVACSGCGIKPTTRPFAEAMPAMPRCEPFGLPLA